MAGQLPTACCGVSPYLSLYHHEKRPFRPTVLFFGMVVVVIGHSCRTDPRFSGPCFSPFWASVRRGSRRTGLQPVVFAALPSPTAPPVVRAVVTVRPAPWRSDAAPRPSARLCASMPRVLVGQCLFAEADDVTFNQPHPPRPPPQAEVRRTGRAGPLRPELARPEDRIARAAVLRTPARRPGEARGAYRRVRPRGI
jgi:hypothetical protein